VNLEEVGVIRGSFTPYGKNMLSTSGTGAPTASIGNPSFSPEATMTSAKTSASTSSVKKFVTYSSELDVHAHANRANKDGSQNDVALPHELEQIDQELDKLMKSMEEGEGAVEFEPVPVAPFAPLESNPAPASAADKSSSKLWSTVPTKSVAVAPDGGSNASPDTGPASSRNSSMAANPTSRSKVAVTST